MHRSGAAWIVTLVLATLAASVPPRALAEPAAAGAVIVAIELECAARIDRDGLLRILPVRLGDHLDSGTLDRVRERVAQTELFSAVTAEAQPRPNGVALIVHLVRQSILDSLRFRGNQALGDYELQRVARLREGMVFTDDARQAALSRLRERYAAEGFEAATVAMEVCPRSPGEVDVVVRIDEGPPLLIDAIDVAGALPLSEDEVREASGLEAGDRYTRARQRRAQTAIVRLFRERQYYEADVSSAWVPAAAGHRGVLRFTIVPGPPFTVGFSGNQHFSDARLLRLMDLPSRPIITDGTWRQLARRVQRAYQEAGYAAAQVALHVEPGPPKVVRFEVQEGERYRIGAVRFEGNHGVSSEQLLNQMGTRPPSWIPWRRGIFLEDVFDEDLKRLWFFYRRQGFQSAEIVDAQTRVDAPSRRVLVTVFIEEGPRTIVRAVRVDGTEAIAGTTPALHVAVDRPLDPDDVEADRRALVNAFTQNGYTQAVVTATIDTAPEGDGEAATVHFAAQPGERQFVGTIIVQGNFDTRARVITRELPVRRGNPLNPDALLQGQSNMYRLGLFRSATVRPLEAGTASSTADIGVTVSEKPPGTFSIGGGYNTRDGIRGFGEVSYNNLQGLARRLGLRGEFGLDPGSGTFNYYVADLGFREPRLDDTRWTFRSNLLAQRTTQTIYPYSLERYALIPAVERMLSPHLQIGSEMQFEYNNVFDVDADVLAFNPSDQGTAWTGSLAPFAIYDARDDAFVPRRGVFDSLRIKYAPASLGSSVPFIKVVGQHTHYIPLSDALTFVYSFRGGYAFAYEGNDQVPIRERFFLGGRTTVRGFEENKVGPLGYAGDPVGGDVVVNVNTELRFPLVYGLGGVVFVDGGGNYLQHCPSGVGLTNCAHSLENFRRSTGPGLRYITPVGAISLEYGFKLDRRTGESVGEVHFSIGNIF
jgi:outer membrane protein insertion porin family